VVSKPVPLDSLPADLQALLASAAKLIRERYRYPDDAPLMVLLPENPAPELLALLAAED